MYYLTRNSNQQFFNLKNRKWEDQLERTKGYKTLGFAQKALTKQIKLYSGYFQDEERAKSFLSITYSDPTRIIYNLEQKLKEN